MSKVFLKVRVQDRHDTYKSDSDKEILKIKCEFGAFVYTTFGQSHTCGTNKVILVLSSWYHLPYNRGQIQKRKRKSGDDFIL